MGGLGLRQWQSVAAIKAKPDRVEWVRTIPFVILHLGCLGIIWVGWSWTAVAAAIGLYLARMFAITGFYHRYFSHKTFHTSRFTQFLFALLGAAAVQRGPLWWAYQHRHHHQHSDEECDAHSPNQRGFWWAHIEHGSFQRAQFFPRTIPRCATWQKFPELVFLNRFDSLVPAALAVVRLLALGWLLACICCAPDLGRHGGAIGGVGLFISTTALFHATSSINSLAHLMGKRRYETDDNSRNSLILALVTLGEGWHNNHHRYMTSTRQGFYWWEVDISYYVLKAISWTGIIWNLRPVPISAYRRHPAARSGFAGVGSSQPCRKFVTRLAIIGTGIAGLGCAYFLHSRYDLALYEKND